MKGRVSFPLTNEDLGRIKLGAQASLASDEPRCRWRMLASVPDHRMRETYAEALAGSSGHRALAQRFHLLETLGGIPHDCRDAKDLAGQIVERGDRELDRDA